MNSRPFGEATVKSSLDEVGIRPSKRLGQNFLSDAKVIDGILDGIGDDARGSVVEIGPGFGALTFPLAGRAKRLVAVEVDRRLAAHLRESFRVRTGAVEIVTADVLEFDVAAEASRAGELLVIVGSIPYSITAPILKKLISARASIRSAYLITQREVAEKIQASPGKQGTALGVLVQAYADASILRRIPRSSFHPVPKVDSCLWKLTILPRPRFTSSEDRFFAVVRAIYGARRKTLRNALQRSFPLEDVDAMLSSAHLDPSLRGETLGFSELDRLASATERPTPSFS